jgi:hypothetical protein
VKAVATWVELSVIKEESPNTFVLLNVAEKGVPSKPAQKQPGKGKFPIQAAPVSIDCNVF